MDFKNPEKGSVGFDLNPFPIFDQ